MKKEQTKILIGMIIGLIVALLVVIIPFFVEIIPIFSTIEILVLALIIPTISYIVGIVRIAKLRFVDISVMNPMENKTTDKLRAYKQYVSNTQEQLILAFITYSILSFTLPAGSNYLILILSLLFGVGRILFAVGYTKGASHRALGFTLTFYPTVISFIAGIVCLLIAFSIDWS